jgi:hypothetical protein
MQLAGNHGCTKKSILLAKNHKLKLHSPAEDLGAVYITVLSNKMTASG